MEILLNNKALDFALSANNTTLKADLDGVYEVPMTVSPAIQILAPRLQEKTVVPDYVAQYVTADDNYDGLSSVSVQAMARPYEFVQKLYEADFNLSKDTTYDSWTASTTAGSIKATATLTNNSFVADLEHYEYLLWWKMWTSVAYNSGATLKAMPIWEGMDAVQSVFRRPNSLATLVSGDKAGTACVTQSTAPLLTYYDTNGVIKYTFSNTYGLYGTVQAAAISDTAVLNPTISPKRPIIYARCSSTYFATGRKTQINSADTTFSMICNLYRMPLDRYGQTKLYEGIVQTYNA